MSTSKGSAAGSIRQAVVTTLVLLLICGFLFPVLMTGLGSLIFPSQAGGNLIYVDGQPVGSRFVGQEFTDPRFMRGRPSQYHYNTYYVAVQIPTLAENTGLSEERLEEIVEANTTHKVLGIFGEEAVNVLGVNLAIAQELGLIGEVSK